MMRLPFGYRFFPTDEELILRYLLKRVKGEPLPSEAITDCEIYGDNDKEPWKIFGETSKKFYVFTKLKKKGKGKRIERKAGCGTWKGQRTDHVKDSQNNHVGFKKLFVFEVKDCGSNNDNKGHWLMHEFSLLNDESDYVLCAIRNKHGIDVVDDQPQQNRIRFNNSSEDEQNSFIEAATPIYNLTSDEALSFAAASNSFTEAGISVSTVTLDDVLGFAAASSYEDGFTAEQLIPEEFSRDLLGAEDAKQVQILNESASALDFDSGASALAFDAGAALLLDFDAGFSDSDLDHISFSDMLSFDDLL